LHYSSKKIGAVAVDESASLRAVTAN